MITQRASAGRRRFDARAKLVVLGAALGLMVSQLPGALASRPGDADPTFGTGGLVTDHASGAEVASAMAIQSDKKIVVAGRALNADGNYDFMAARYNADGTVDTTFGPSGTGKVTIGFGATSNEFAFALALDSQHRVVLAGTTNNTPTARNVIAVARLTSAGILDTTFGSGGKTTTTLNAYLDRAAGVAVDDQDRPVVVGQTYNGTDDDFAVVRYRVTGTNGDNTAVDTTFGTNGAVVTAIGTGNDRAYGIAIQSDKKILVGGSSVTSKKDDFAVARYSTTGALDTTFNSGGAKPGVATMDLGPSDVDIAYSIAIQPADGRIVLAGSSSNGVDDDFGVARLLTTGLPDTSFNTTGMVRTAIGTSDDVAQSVTVQPLDGRIVVAGFSKSATDKNFGIIRYLSDGTLDSTFGSGGKLITGGPNDDEGFAVAVQPDTKIVAAGDFDKGVEPSLAIVRLVGVTVSVGDTSAVVDASATTKATFTVSLGAPSGTDVTVSYATADGTAHAGVDYVATSGSVTIPAGTTTKTVDVVVLPNGAIKPDATFSLLLSNPVNGALDDATGVATLLEHHARKYWLIASDGGVFAFGTAQFFGSTGGLKLVKPVVGGVASQSGNGYWMVASDGGIFAFGDAPFRGSTGGMKLNQPIVSMTATPDGQGYWLVASDGGIFAFGAPFYGSTGGMKLNQPIVGMAANPAGPGYWMVASDGGIFAFGGAGFFGSTGAIKLNKPIVGMAPTPTGKGYWLVASDGGIFAYGDAQFFGSTGAITLNQPIVGMSATGSGNGYWLVASDGGIFAYGDAEFEGSTGGIKLNSPIVGMLSR